MRETRRADLNQLAIDPANASQIIVEQVLPENVGGWWIREIGIYDEAGDLCAVANCPPSYKPVMAEGSARTQVVRVVLIVASTAAIELKIDPAIILATRKYVDDQDIVVRAYSDTLMAQHLADLDPHPQYSLKEVKTLAKFDASKKLVNADFVQQAQGNMVRYTEVTESRTLTAEDIGCALYFPSAGKAITIPD
ncbi:phage tail protein, partial [Janthinobacterium sp. AD80]|uniref:phage tail protein n=1 Tax=Janthinobacterium sp. AD80 TaxID=1528773 RepID=UPI002155F24A